MNINIYHSSSASNVYRIDDGNTPILLEAGAPIKKIKEALNYKLSNIAGCLISHSHMDHAKGLKDLLQCGVDCYVSPETAQALDLSGHRLHIIKPMEQFKIGTWTIKAFYQAITDEKGEIKHLHDAPCLGFLMVSGENKVLFAIDTNYIPYRFRGLTHIMLGVNYDNEILMDNVTLGHIHPELTKRILKNHMSLRTAKNFFRANDMSKVREIYLLHLSDGNSNAERFKTEIQQITGRPVYV